MDVLEEVILEHNVAGRLMGGDWHVQHVEVHHEESGRVAYFPAGEKHMCRAGRDYFEDVLSHRRCFLIWHEAMGWKTMSKPCILWYSHLSPGMYSLNGAGAAIMKWFTTSNITTVARCL